MPLTQSSDNALSSRFQTTPAAAVQALLQTHFGLEGTVSVLNSERDETFRLTSDDGRAHIVKLASPQERRDILAFQTDAMLHLAGKGLDLPLPRPIASGNGDYLVDVETAGERRILRVLTYLDGVLLYRTQPSLPQMAAVGRALGLLSAALADFRQPAPQQRLLWDLSHAPDLRAYLPRVAPERQPLVAGVLDALDRLEEGALRDVRRQVIHNDFNPYNILVDAGNPACVTGVIDFGDMVEAPLVNDLAVALSYQVAQGDDLAPVLAMLAAYHAVQPLQSAELRCLPALIRGRLAMTITITEWRAGLYPENRDYILRNHPSAERGLDKLSSATDQQLADILESSLGGAR